MGAEVAGAARTGTTAADAVARRIPAAAPLPRALRAVIGEVVWFIEERFQPDAVVLYGSRVAGKPRAESDVDLMVILDCEDGAAVARTIRDAVGREFGAIGSRFDIRTMTPRRVRLGLSENDFFVADVMNAGVVLAGSARSRANGGGGTERRRSGLKKVTEDWLAKADDDLRVAGMVVGMPEPPLALACFQAQQSAEKELKAYLQERTIRFPRTHRLDLLVDLAGGELQGIVALRPDLVWLTDFAVDSRYPESDEIQADGERCVRLAREVRALVRGALGFGSGAGTA